MPEALIKNFKEVVRNEASLLNFIKTLNPIDFFTVDELLDEIEKRSLVVVFARQYLDQTTSRKIIGTYYSGGWLASRGLATYLQEFISESDDDDNEK